MKNHLLNLCFIGLSALSYAQVGIGTNDPKSTLHIIGSPTVAATPDGVIPPIISRTNLIAKTGYSSLQKGAIVYLDDISGTAPTVGSSTEKVTSIGYYYFDGTIWNKLNNIITASNGLTKDATSGDVQLGGTLTKTTTVAQGANTLAFTGTAVNAFSVDGTTLSIDAANNRVGIGNSTPYSTLDVTKSSVNTTTSIDGIKAPILTKQELASKASTTYGTNQNGTIVYVSDISGTISGTSLNQVQNVKATGYFYFDGNLWQPIAGAIQKIQGSMVAANGNNTSITSGTSTIKNLNSNIILPVGKWKVEINIILDVGSTVSNSYTWTKLSFTDNTTTLATSADITSTSKLISGAVTTVNIAGGDTNPFYGVITGKVIIENTSGGNKTYYLTYNSSNYKGATRTINRIGSSDFSENFMLATRVQ